MKQIIDLSDYEKELNLLERLQHETEDTNKLEALFAVLCCDIWNISSDSIVLDDAWNNTVVVCR